MKIEFTPIQVALLGTAVIIFGTILLATSFYLLNWFIPFLFTILIGTVALQWQLWIIGTERDARGIFALFED